jgi:hypothetical protein
MILGNRLVVEETVAQAVSVGPGWAVERLLFLDVRSTGAVAQVLSE